MMPIKFHSLNNLLKKVLLAVAAVYDRRLSETQELAVTDRRYNCVPISNGACVLVFALLVGCNHGPQHDAANAVAAADDRIPHTLAELNAWYAEPPAGQNAATFLLQGFDALQLGNVASSNVPLLGKGKLPPLDAPLAAPTKSAIAALARSNRDALQLFTQGRQYEQSRYPVDLTLGLDALFPHVPKLKNAVALVDLTAIFHAEAGDGTQAANEVLIALALARSLEAEPALLSQLIRAASVSTSIAAFEQVVNRTTLPSESLSELVKAFQKMEEHEAHGEGFSRAMTAERVIALSLFQAPAKLLQACTAPGANIPVEQRNQIAARVQKGDKFIEEQEFLGRAFDQLVTARKETFPDRLKADDLIRERVSEAVARKLAIVGVLLPGLAGRTAREAECLADLRLGLAAVALEQFRAAHDNCYPVALSELTPAYLDAVPLDPFDSQPLRYEKKNVGYVLYSIGPDLKDDSGARMNGKVGDIVFEVVNPARPRK